MITKRTRAVVLPLSRRTIEQVSEHLNRRAGNYLALVVQQIGRGEEPSREDIARALRQRPPKHEAEAALVDYVISRYVLMTTPLKAGRKASQRRSLRDEGKIIVYYLTRLELARGTRESNSRAPRNITTIALRETAQAFGVSTKTVRRIVAGASFSA